jgi:hypothetical protein
MFKIVAAILAVYSYFLIQTSLPSLPSRIPIHFNLAGKADGWGSPHTLWVLLIFQVLVACIMLSVSFWSRRFPQSVHLGARRLSDFTPDQRERILPSLERMGGWMSVATSLFFIDIIREAIRAADPSHSQFHLGWAPVLFVASMIGLALYYVWRINKVSGTTQP